MALCGKAHQQHSADNRTHLQRVIDSHNWPSRRGGAGGGTQGATASGFDGQQTGGGEGQGVRPCCAWFVHSAAERTLGAFLCSAVRACAHARAHDRSLHEAGIAAFAPSGTWVVGCGCVVCANHLDCACCSAGNPTVTPTSTHMHSGVPLAHHVVMQPSGYRTRVLHRKMNGPANTRRHHAHPGRE